MVDEPTVFIGEPDEILVQMEHPLAYYKERGSEYVTGSVLHGGRAYRFGLHTRSGMATSVWDGKECLADRKDGKEAIIDLVGYAARLVAQKLKEM